MSITPNDIISAFESGYKKGLAERRRQDKRDAMQLEGYLADKILAKISACLSDGIKESAIVNGMRRSGGKTDIRAALSELELAGKLRCECDAVRGREVRRWHLVERGQ